MSGIFRSPSPVLQKAQTEAWGSLYPLHLRHDRVGILGLDYPHWVQLLLKQRFHTGRGKQIRPVATTPLSLCLLIEQDCHPMSRPLPFPLLPGYRSVDPSLPPTPVQWSRSSSQEERQTLRMKSSAALTEVFEFIWSRWKILCLKALLRRVEVLVESN